MPSVAELVAALPEISEMNEEQSAGPLPELLATWSQRPVPAGAFAG